MVTTIHKPVLIVIAGPNGSGKTTITTQILQHEWMENAVYINPDQIAKDKFGDWNSREAIITFRKQFTLMVKTNPKSLKDLVPKNISARHMGSPMQKHGPKNRYA